MKKIYVATNTRGFLLNLFNSSLKNIQFIWDENKVYEMNTKLKLFLSSIVRSPIGNYLGLIQRVKVSIDDFDIAFSFNRFLDTKKKYVIYLENPTALFHYCLGRNETFLGKRKIEKYLKDKNLKAIICMSKACYDTIKYFYRIPNEVRIEQIYPFIPKNPFISLDRIREKSYRPNIICLYISSNFKLKGGREIITCFKKFKGENVDNLLLKVVTNISSLGKDIMHELKTMKNIEVIDFKLNKDELFKLYSDANILLHPTRQDSFPLVILEAMKAGNVILATDLYAIPEMVVDGYNGYLVSPKYRFFDSNNMPNKIVWNNRKRTIYSDYIDENIVQFLYEKIKFLNENRECLEKLAINSFCKSNSGEFADKYILDKWNELFNSI